MKTIGQMVEESLDYADRGSLEIAFLPACEALRQTAEMVHHETNTGEPPFQRFIRDNWRLISFMGIPRMDSVPPNLPFGIRRVIPSFIISNIYEEIVIYTVRQTLTIHRVPLEIGFNSFGGTMVENDKLLLPKSLIFSILGSVVFNPLNQHETVADRYWLNIWDFKMFVSELWGRMDLAERVMKLYQ